MQAALARHRLCWAGVARRLGRQLLVGMGVRGAGAGWWMGAWLLLGVVVS